MKLTKFILALLFFATTQVFSQNNPDAITGIVKEVKPHFGGAHSIVIGETELVLITSPKDKTGKTFVVNKQFKDILIDKKGTYILNPKYANKELKFTYTVNGKGWKCIETINTVKK